MEGIVTALLLAIQVVNGNPVNQECCASKTVGDYSYTRVDTSVGFPDACLATCAYSRDDQPGGSLYCFGAGSLAVKCLDEKPMIMSKDVGPWGSLSPAKAFTDIAAGTVNKISIFTGPSEPFDLVVLGIAITYAGADAVKHGNTGPTLKETKCERDQAAGQFFGGVKGQSFENTPADNFLFQLEFHDTTGGLMCRSPPTTSGEIKIGPASTDAKLLSISGSTTVENPAQIASLTFNYQEGPWGILPDAKAFTDIVAGTVNKISIFTGPFESFKIVVLGIAITYGSADANKHGNTGPNLIETKCERDQKAGQFFGGIKARSFETTFVFQLEFRDTTGKVICSSPSTPSGVIQSKSDVKLLSISGSTTGENPARIASLTFNFS